MIYNYLKMEAKTANINMINKLIITLKLNLFAHQSNLIKFDAVHILEFLSFSNWAHFCPEVHILPLSSVILC